MFKGFHASSGTPAFEGANLGGMIKDYLASTGSSERHFWSPNGDPRQDADLVVFEVEDAEAQFDPRDLTSLPAGVSYFGHCWTEPASDVLDDLDAAA